MIGFVEYLISKGYKPYRKVMSKKGSTYVESKPKEAEELAEPVVMAVAELFFARMAYTRALKEGLELQ